MSSRATARPSPEATSSPAAEEALAALLDSTFGILVDGIGAARGKSATEVKALIDGAPYAADEALAAGLVDALAYPDEFKTFIEEAAGSNTPRLLSLADYSPRSTPFGAPKVAVLYAVGSIVRGHGGESAFTGETAVGSDDLGKSLRALAEDEAVGAVVLRIDSPGGSALASDLILREVDRLRAKKPVIVSMADVAASGGYYIAARATKIVAEASTITGSIGVVSGKFVTRAFEKDLLGAYARHPRPRRQRWSLWLPGRLHAGSGRASRRPDGEGLRHLPRPCE